MSADLDVEDVRSALPQHLKADWSELVDDTISDDTPLTIGVVGPFSVGKSSLLNTLLERDILPVGQTETTALPVFLQYGEDWSFEHARSTDEAEVISESEFQELAEKEARPGEFTVVTTPREWLKGCQIVDLPGLGAVDEDRRILTRAQIASVDVVLYMLEPRGPTDRDTENLSHASARGKHIKVLAGQWDRVIQSAKKHNEPMVDLEDWSATLEDEVGSVFEIQPVSENGHGQDELLSYFASLGDEKKEIRRRRFVAEASALLEHATSDLNDQKQTITAETEEEIEELKNKLQDQRSSLLEMKSEAHDSREKARQEMQTSFESVREQAVQQLENKVSNLRKTVLADPSEETWQTFVNDANSTAESILNEITDEAQTIHGEAFDVDGLKADWSEIHIQFPPAPELDHEDWLDSAQRKKIREQLSNLSDDLESQDENAADGGERSEPATDELRDKLHTLYRKQDRLRNQELPEKRIEDGGSSAGSIIGKTAGEVGDIALMFVQPQLIATKVASWLSKGGKALNLGSKGMKVVRSAQKAVKTAGKAADKVSSARKASVLGKNVNEPGKIAKAFGFFEKFSLSYWLEKVGGMFDAPPNINFQVAPEAVEQKQQALEETRSEIRSLQEKLDRVEEEQHQQGQTDYQKTLKEREYNRLEKQLEQEKEKAQKREKELEEERQRLLEERVSRKSKRFAQKLRYRLTQQIRGIEKKLNESFNAYWEEELEEAFTEKEARLRELEDKIDEKPEEKEEQLNLLNQRMEKLRTYSTTLQV